MKTAKRILSLLIAAVMLFTAVPFASAEEESSVEQYEKEMLELGIPVISTEDFGKILRVINTFKYLLTGEESTPEKFNVTLDEVILDISSQICAESGLDLGLIAANIPDINVIANYFKNKYSINTTEFREARYKKAEEYLANGNDIMASVCHAIGAYMSIIQKLYIYTEKTDEKDVYKVMLYLEYEDGTNETHDAGLHINMKTGECYNDKGTGMFGSGYNFNIYEMVVYTTVDCWMRNFGFCILYDILANVNPISYSYVTRRFKFEYDGLEWMIQIWKGNYFISNGGEVGIYSREPGEYKTSFYNCASEDQELMMSMQILLNDKVLVNRPLQRHWWISGFNIGTMRYLPSVLTLKSTIVMPDEEMLEAFTASIDENVMGDVSYTVDGLKVNLVW